MTRGFCGETNQQVSYLSRFNRIFALILAAYGRFAEVGLKIRSLLDLSEAPGQGVIFALLIQLAHLSVPQLDCDLSVGKGGWEGVVRGGFRGEWCAESSILMRWRLVWTSLMRVGLLFS